MRELHTQEVAEQWADPPHLPTNPPPRSHPPPPSPPTPSARSSPQSEWAFCCAACMGEGEVLGKLTTSAFRMSSGFGTNSHGDTNICVKNDQTVPHGGAACSCTPASRWPWHCWAPRVSENGGPHKHAFRLPLSLCCSLLCPLRLWQAGHQELAALGAAGGFVGSKGAEVAAQPQRRRHGRPVRAQLELPAPLLEELQAGREGACGEASGGSSQLNHSRQQEVVGLQQRVGSWQLAARGKGRQAGDCWAPTPLQAVWQPASESGSHRRSRRQHCAGATHPSDVGRHPKFPGSHQLALAALGYQVAYHIGRHGHRHQDAARCRHTCRVRRRVQVSTLQAAEKAAGWQPVWLHAGRSRSQAHSRKHPPGVLSTSPPTTPGSRKISSPQPPPQHPPHWWNTHSADFQDAL